MEYTTYRSKGVCVQRQECEDCLQQLRDGVTVSSDQPGTLVTITDGGGGEVCISQDDLVAMTHGGQGMQQLRRQDTGNAFQYHLDLK